MYIIMSSANNDFFMIAVARTSNPMLDNSGECLILDLREERKSFQLFTI